MNFKDIYGHEKIKELLMRSVAENKIGHAYIFDGKSGVGRLSTALAFAAAQMCEASVSGNACGNCENCNLSRGASHPDIRVITNELYDPSKAEGRAVSVDTIRAMKKEIYIKPYVAPRKVYIVPNADTMTAAAQNSLLKVLEEPPSYCTIILISENFNAFLPTVLSRAAVIKFAPLSVSEILQYLNDTQEENSQSFEVVSKMCGGSIKAAKELLDNEDIIKARGEILQLLLGLKNLKKTGAYSLIAYAKKNKKMSAAILETIGTFLSDLLIIKNYETKNGIVNIDIYENLQDFANQITVETPLKMLDIYVKYSKMLQANGNYAACIECLILGLHDVR